MININEGTNLDVTAIESIGMNNFLNFNQTFPPVNPAINAEWVYYGPIFQHDGDSGFDMMGVWQDESGNYCQGLITVNDDRSMSVIWSD